MHRTIEITVPPQATDTLAGELSHLDEVIGLYVLRGASLKPPGDVLIVHVLNRGADDVLKCAARTRDTGPVSVATSELASIIDLKHTKQVDNDIDEAVWEEMETGLRHQGRITSNYLALMALGGAIATVGLVSSPAPQAIAFVAASVIAPGFEPIAKIPLGLVLRRGNVIRRGLVSTVTGYTVLVLAAALAFLLLRTTGAAGVEDFLINSEVKHLAHPTAKEILVSACAASAGAVMIASYRDNVIAGPLIALVIIHAAAKVGVALALGRFDLVREGLQRLGLDVLLITVLCVIVFAAKQALIHRRKPLV